MVNATLIIGDAGPGSSRALVERPVLGWQHGATLLVDEILGIPIRPVVVMTSALAFIMLSMGVCDPPQSRGKVAC
jgi:hypothetical protein